jgi:hypothetical protein
MKVELAIEGCERMTVAIPPRSNISCNGWWFSSTDCARGRAMPLGFGGIFFEVPAGIGTATQEGSIGQA